MTLVALPTQVSSTAAATIPVQRGQLRELQTDYERLRASLLIEEMDADEVESPLALLLDAIRDRAERVLGIDPNDFIEWLEEALPPNISGQAGEGSTDAHARLADTLDELDGILLTAIEEIARADEADMTGPRAEAHLAELWRTTFTSAAAAQEAWLEQAFVHRGRAIVETVYPDAEERRRLYQYGFSPVVGRRFEEIAPRLRALVASAITYGEDDATARIDVFEEIGELLAADRGFGFRVRQTDTDRALLRRWADVLGWWMHEPGAQAPDADNLRAWQRFVADNLEFRLGVAIGAVVAQAWSEGAPDAFTVPTLGEWKATTGMPWFGFWARELLRWGTHDPFVAFALSQNLAQTREAAAARREEFETWLNGEYDDIEPDDLIDPQLFLEWQGSLPRRAPDPAVEQPEPAALTGTDGRRQRYNVIPIADGAVVRWLDPAGFELARSEDILGLFDDRLNTNDYELRIGRRGSAVYRTFAAGSRA